MMMQSASENIFTKLRIQKGVTQREAATALKISPASLSAYELGKKTPSVDVAVRMCAYYGITLEKLFRSGEAKTDTLHTYADVLECLFKLGSTRLSFSIDASETEVGGHGKAAVIFSDDYLCRVFKTWAGLLESQKNDFVDDEVLQLWQQKRLDEARNMALAGARPKEQR